MWVLNVEANLSLVLDRGFCKPKENCFGNS